MTFADLHELLRLELARRIDAGTLTGTRLAQQTGFQQAHISNFLNRKRSLSLEGLDRVLTSQGLTIDQILPLTLAAMAADPREPTELVPVVSPSVAMTEPQISSSSVIEHVHISTSLLYEKHPRASGSRSRWHRFIAVRADAQQAAAMDPVLPVGSIAIIDRHYVSLSPYRAGRSTLYAVRCGSSLLLRFVDLDEAHLILRPHSIAFPVQLIAITTAQTPSEFIVGRICLILAEV